jgi:hypothetical protein
MKAARKLRGAPLGRRKRFREILSGQKFPWPGQNGNRNIFGQGGSDGNGQSRGKEEGYERHGMAQQSVVSG